MLNMDIVMGLPWMLSNWMHCQHGGHHGQRVRSLEAVSVRRRIPVILTGGVAMMGYAGTSETPARVDDDEGDEDNYTGC